MRSTIRRAAGLLCCAAATTAWADTPAPLQGVVSLAATATVELPKDLMSVAFSTTREGADAGVVQSQLRQALDAALAEARKVARPGQLEVQTGPFSLSPRYAPPSKTLPNGGIAGWQGSAELIVEGRDMAAIGQLVGRITTLSVARVGYGLSRELREKTEAEVSAQAIARFRAKAADHAKQFGYAGYTLREVNVGSADGGGPVPMLALRSKTMAAPAGMDESLPVEAGKGTVSVSVNGSVQLTR